MTEAGCFDARRIGTGRSRPPGRKRSRLLRFFDHLPSDEGGGDLL